MKNIEPEKSESCLWVKDIAHKDRFLNIIETSIVKDETKTDYAFVTDLNISKRNADRIASAGGSRWKIENQGFNNQKNIRYDIEHACCLNYNAMKNHYLIVQITDILRQLLENGVEEIKNLKSGIKEISSRLLESFRREKVTIEDIAQINTRIKIRLS